MPALHRELLNKVGHTHLKKGDAGGHRRNHDRKEEDCRHYRADHRGALAHLREDIRHAAENQAGTRAGLYSRREDSRHYGEAGKNGEKQVGDRSARAGGEDILARGHIGAVGDDGAHTQGQGVEALAHSVGEGARRQGGEIRLHQIADSRERTGQADGIDGNHHYKHKQGREGYLAEALDSRLHARRDHQRAEEQEEQVHQHRLRAVRDKAVKHGTDLRRLGVDEGHRRRLVQIIYRPAADDAVVRSDDKRDGDGQKAHDFPEALARRQLPEGCEGIAAAAPSYHHLRNEDGQGDEQGRGNIDDDEHGTTVLPHHIGKTPDVAQTYGRAGHCQDDSHTAAEIFSLR